MGSVIDHRLDYTGEGALRGQRHIWQRAVSYFSLLSYYTQNLSTQAAKLLAVRNEHVSLKRKKEETADLFVLSGDNEAVKVIFI